jgi:membrane protein implicated in regulation of membrane protease activity
MSQPVIWFFVGVACFIMESFTPGFVLMFFGVGALAASLVTAFYADTAAGLATFCVVSIASVVFLRSRVMRMMQGWTNKPSERALQGVPASQAGRTGTVSRRITPTEGGEISLGGSFWRAEADEILEEGAAIVVLGAREDDDLVLRVTPAAK